MPRLISIDPGVASGVAFGHFDETTPYRLDDIWVLTPEETEDWIWTWVYDVPRVYEGFRLRSGNKFTADLAGVELIGQMRLVARKRGLQLTKQMPPDKALVSDPVLKSGGLWQTGSMVGHTDGRDANDAIIHALAYLKKAGHTPTIQHYWPETLED